MNSTASDSEGTGGDDTGGTTHGDASQGLDGSSGHAEGSSTVTGVGSSSAGDSGMLEPCSYEVEGCDIDEQNCPGGGVCRPYLTDELELAAGCFEPGGAAAGDACMLECDAGGYDDCGPGLACDPLSTGERHCAVLCTTNDPCGPGRFCLEIEAGDGFVFGVCALSCDLVAQDCGVGEMCVPDGDASVCVPAGPGGPGDECADEFDCNVESFCAEAGSFGCPEDGGCCVELCDTALDECNCLPLEGPLGGAGIGGCAAPVEPKPKPFP